MNDEAIQLLADVKSKFVQEGMTPPDDVELMRMMTDAVSANLDPKHTAIWHISQDELLLLHSRISAALRSAGLKGSVLDQAIADAFREAIRPIERERSIEWERSQNIREVK